MTLVETRSPLRTIVALLAAAAALLAATGIVELKAFHEPSTLKYGLTIGAPLITVLACTMERPLRLITSLAIVAVPFVGATAAFASTRVSVLVPLLIAGAGLAIVYGPRASRLSSLGLAALFAVPLLSIPVFIGSSQRPFIVALFLLLDVAWLVSRTADDPGGMKVVLAAVAVSAAIQGAIAIWQARTGHQLNLYGSAGSQQFSANYIFTYGSALRPTGAFTDPVSLGDVLGISVPVVAALGIAAHTWTRRLLLLAAGALAGTGLALSLSRASWIGAVVGLALTLLLLPRLTRRRAAPVVAAGVVAIGAVGYLLAGSAVQGRLASILNPTNTQGQSAAQQGVAKGDQNRVSYWTIAVDDAFLRHPIAGIGVGNMPRFLIDHESLKQAGLGDARALANSAAIVGTENASSTYFQLLGEAGIFGAVLLLLLFRGLFRDLRAGLRAYPVLGAGLAGAVVALLICWVTDYTIENQPVAASMAILLGAVAAAGRYGSRTGA